MNRPRREPTRQFFLKDFVAWNRFSGLSGRALPFVVVLV